MNDTETRQAERDVAGAVNYAPTDPLDPLNATWHAKPNDLIGGWCVMDTDQTPAEAGRPEIADFTTREHAEHIADLHNAWLARETWHHAPPSSPYTRLHEYGQGGEAPPSREDVMGLLRSFNASNVMNGVHKRRITRQWERLDMAKRELAEMTRTRDAAIATALHEYADRLAAVPMDCTALTREQTSASTGNGRSGEQARVEVLWSNRPLGAQGVLDFEAGAA